MIYIKLFENFNTESIDDILLDSIENKTCIKSGNEYCYMYVFDNEEVFDNAKSRLDDFNIKYETSRQSMFRDPSDEPGVNYEKPDNIILQTSNDLINYLDKVFKNLKKNDSDIVKGKWIFSYYREDISIEWGVWADIERRFKLETNGFHDSLRIILMMYFNNHLNLKVNYIDLHMVN
jgi:hypothetical protein